jgi:DNA primase
MEIQDIKTRLSISAVLQHYGLKPDKNARLCCPFHEDKTPSMQVYYKTQTAYCFSANCKTHGKSMDVIDFIMHRENTTKHEAIKKAEDLLGSSALTNPNGATVNHPKIQQAVNSDVSREQFLASIFQYFKNAVYNSKPAQAYIAVRCLDFKATEIGYNGAQFHHGARRNETLISRCLEYGLLTEYGGVSKTGEAAYRVFGKYCIVFPLKNAQNQIVSLYFRSTTDDSEARHFYLRNRAGLYPAHPPADARILILTESVIDAASLYPTANYELQDTCVLACYGTNGLTEEHRQAIKELAQLEEIVFAFDMDEAGREAAGKYAAMLRGEYPKLKITTLDLPCKDVNETLQGHDKEIFTHLIQNRIDIFLSIEKKEETSETSEKEEQPPETPKPASPTSPISPASPDFLHSPRLVDHFNELIGLAGIVGEEQSRMLLFLIALSYINRQPLHALVQGSSGSGKTHIINRIADLMPPEDVLRFTRITENSLYNWGEFDLLRKVVVIEDLDGLKEDALYALREFISNQVLRSSVTVKDKKGNNRSQHKIVKGQFSSLSATTRGETYEDNMSRSFLIAVDESREQTARIISWQNRRSAGVIEPEAQQKAINAIRQAVRQLKHYEVVNPFATRLHLPEKVHKARRLNEMYQAVIRQVTLLNQYQRKTAADGRLITDVEDIRQATEILFESIVLKVDELDGSLRQFFERLKNYVKDEKREFILRDVRQHLNISKTQMFRYMQSLVELEYIKPSGGYVNTGIKYQITYWDNYQKIRTEIKEFLFKQIQQLKGEG